MRVPSISWISRLCRSALLLLYLMCGVPAPLLRVRSISHITLGLFSREAFTRPRSIDAPFQTSDPRPHRFAEIVRVGYGLQRPARVETKLSQLRGILVVNHLILVWSSMTVHGWTQNENTNPNQSQDGASGSEDLVCGGGFDCVAFQNINPVVEKRHSGLARVRRHYCRLASRVAEVGFKRYSQLNGSVTYMRWAGCAQGARRRRTPMEPDNRASGRHWYIVKFRWVGLQPSQSR